jgi:hypothetical protein
MEQPITAPQGRPRVVRILFWVVIGILTALCFAAVFAVAVTLLWNWLMTDLFGLKPINYFQAFGLILLARLLVGGWHKGHGDDEHSHFHRFFTRKKGPLSDRGDRDSEEFQAFWNKEGREVFKSYLKNRSGEAG